MPDAYENYMAFARQMQKLPDASMMVSRDANYFTYDYDSSAGSTTSSFSPASILSPGSQQMETFDSLPNAEVFEIIGNPISHDIGSSGRTEIKIVVQPFDGFRFRYKSELTGTHGSISGTRDDSSSGKKEPPTVQLINCPVKNAVIRCTLVTATEDARFPHAHHLVRKDENGDKEDKDDPHDIKVSDENDYTAVFSNMGIIHTAKKNIKEEISRKRMAELLEDKKRSNHFNTTLTTKEEMEMKMEVQEAQKHMNLNIVALCFQGFCYGENDVLYPLTDKVYSRPINNLKSAETGELRICRISKFSGSCDGNEDVWLLVEKVSKKNIKVKFYEVDDSDNIVWEREAHMSELDVHHQYAIVCRTPAYDNINITQPVDVFVRLERPSDGKVSSNVKFVYKPSKNLNRKRARMSSTSASMDFVQKTKPAQELESNFMSETVMTLPIKEISNVSQELKLLGETVNDYTWQEEGDPFAMHEELLLENCTGKSLPRNINDDLVSDSPAIPRREFALDSLKKLIDIFKEMKSSGKSQSTMTDIRNVLQHTINFGNTALHFALLNEQFDLAKYILTFVAGDPMFKSVVDMQNSSGKTPLHLAAMQNQPEIVRTLLKLGADPNISDGDDTTALHNAVMAQSNSCIDELLRSSKKLNLEACTESGWSALHLAALMGSLHAVRALINAGADVNSTDMSYGRTVLHIAIENNHAHIVDYLLTKTKINVNMKNFGGNTALHSAVVKGGKCAEELVTILKNHGADPRIRNNNAHQEEEDEDDAAVESRKPNKKSESSDSDEEMKTTGESSFDLARDDPKLMMLLSQPKSQDEKLIFKEEPMVVSTLDDDQLTDGHFDRIKGILDQTGAWERLAQYTNNSSHMRLHRKTSSPSSALLNRIRIQQPSMTLSQLKKLLMDVGAYDAAAALDVI